MTFQKRPLSNVVDSTDGYRVEILSRTLILYEDNIRRVFMSAEAYAVDGDWAFYPDDMRLGTEAGAHVLDEQLRAFVLDRIKAAFAFMKWPFHIL